MSSDLLFSILPREGKVPIVHDELKVHKVTKEPALRQLSDQEQELHLEERDARQQQQSQAKKHAQDEEANKDEDETHKDADVDKESDSDNLDKGFKHLDIYI